MFLIKLFRKFHSFFSLRDNSLHEFEKIIHYKFRSKILLKRALTHRSAIGNGYHRFSYERLEYLGDAVLQLVVSHHLFEQYPESDEGILTQFRSRIVNRNHLAHIARKHNFHVLSDLFESIIGAVFIDGGLEAAKRFVNYFLFSDIESAKAISKNENYKGMLIEYCQRYNLSLPKFSIKNTETTEHTERFFASVFVDGDQLGIGVGASKKQAEQNAAKDALEQKGFFC